MTKNTMDKIKELVTNDAPTDGRQVADLLIIIRTATESKGRDSGLVQVGHRLTTRVFNHNAKKPSPVEKPLMFDEKPPCPFLDTPMI